ncbi:MAG: PAS domain-containing protein [Nitrospirales bacterium]|nr:PAS domain-containing protein [Nitrospirales bacterium]
MLTKLESGKPTKIWRRRFCEHKRRTDPRESEQRHAQVLDSAMDAIMTIDQWCITFVNRAAATTFHLSVEAKGEALERFLTPAISKS